MNTIYDGSYVLGSTSALTFEAGPGITIDSPSAGTVRIGNDETVLYSAAAGSSAGQLSESKNNFSVLRYDVGYSGGYNNNEGSVLIDIPASHSANWLNYSFGGGGANLYYAGAKIVWSNDTTFAINHATSIVHNENSTAISGVTAYNAGCRLCVNKIIGINRISGSNA